MNAVARFRDAGPSLWIAVFVCGGFFVATLYSAFYIELGFDPAYHASVAKNFANGYGWASSYDRALPFNPDVTTGPAMLLPVAAMIALFGNALWVPAVTAALLQLVLYGLILLRLRDCFERPRDFHLCVIALSLLMAIHAHTWWLSLTADFLVCLCLLLASLLLTAPSARPAWHRYFLAGLVLGYALLAKALVGFGFVGLALYAVLCWRVVTDRAAAARALGAMALGVLLLVLPWKLYEAVSLTSLQPAQRAERAEYARDFFLEQGTGLKEMAETDHLPGLLQENLRRNSGLLVEHLRARYDLPGWLTGVLVLALFGYTALRVRRSETPLQKLLLVLGLIASLQMAWYLLLSASWNAKYTLAPTVLGLVMLCAALAQLRRVEWLIALLILSLFWLPAPTRAYVFTLASFRAQTTDYTQDMLSTRDYLLTRDPAAAPLVGCGWVFVPWEFEYLLPGSQNFRDCRGLIAEGLRFDEDYYLENNPGVREQIAAGRYASAQQHHALENHDGRLPFRYVWTQPVAFDLVINHVFWNVSAYREQYEAVLRACLPQPLHRTRYFTVAHCPAEGLQRNIALDRPSEFLPPSQPQFYIHKPLPIR